MKTLTRRDLVVAGAALGAAAACPPAPSKPDAGPSVDPQAYDHATRVAFSPAAVAESLTLFPETVAAGAMRTSSVLLWTRAVGEPALTLRVWRDVGSSTEVALVKEQAVSVPAAADGNVKVAVDGLAPATWYQYAFFSPDLARRSPIGRVRTAFPDDWREPVTVGATSCASAKFRPFAPLVTMSKQPMDLWLHLGDVSYNDGADTLSTFRAKWQEQLADPGYRALMPAAGAYLVWDDHEFANNLDPEALGPDHLVIVNGRQAFDETLPVELDARGRPWRSYRWGRTVEFFLLDCRLERKPSTRETGAAQFISPEQLAWLQQALTASPCHFKVVMNSTPIGDMPPPLWGGQADRWQGYAAQRDALFGWLEASGLENVWFVSGDFHLGLVHRVDRTGPRRKYVEVCAGPAGNTNPLTLVLEPGQEANAKIAFPPDQFLYAGGNFQATLLTFDPLADTVRVRFMDPSKQDAVTCDKTLRFGEGA